MSTPALSVIRQHFPDARITLLGNPMVSTLLQGHPALDAIITFDRNGVHRGISGRLKLAAELRRQRFDLAIMFPNSFDSALVPWLAGIPRRLGKCSDGRTLLLNGRYHPEQHKRTGHEVEYYLHLLQTFGITGTATPLRLSITGEERQEADELLAHHGIQKDDFVLGINPGASYGSAKRWYPDRFAKVGRQLTATWGAKVVIFGGPEETAIAGDIERNLGTRSINLAGKTTVRQLMALISRCNFFITNDSGPMHIAAACAVPLVAIFGSTDHTGTSPYHKDAVVVRSNVECAPCKLRKCPTDHRCMTGVTVDMVLDAANGLRSCIENLEITSKPTAVVSY